MSDVAEVQAREYLNLCGRLTRSATGDDSHWDAPLNTGPFDLAMPEVRLESVLQMASRVGREVTGTRMFPVRVNHWSEEHTNEAWEAGLTGVVHKNSSLVEVGVTLRAEHLLISAACVVGPTGFAA